MSMSVQECVLDILSYANVYGFQLSNVPEDDVDVIRAVASVNQALQDIYRWGSDSLKYASRSSLLHAPTQITLTAFNGAKIAGITGWQDWMRGCSLLIAGDVVLNRIDDYIPVVVPAVGPITQGGTPGTSAMGYAIVANFVDGSSSVTGIVATLTSPSGIGPTNYNIVPWTDVAAASYDVYRISYDPYPTVSSYALIAAGLTTLVWNDKGESIEAVAGLPFGIVNNPALLLLRSYLGTTGSNLTATVYGDCALLDPDVVAVLEPVAIPPNWRLRPAHSKADFLRWSYPVWSHSGRDYYYVPFYTAWEKITGIPQSYRVEVKNDQSKVGGGSLYIGFNPMPTAQWNVTYDVYKKPYPISRTDLDETGNSDPGVPIRAIPDDMVESLLLPIARWNFLGSHPTAQSRQAKASVKSEYDEVMTNLRNGATFVPQQAPVRARYL